MKKVLKYKKILYVILIIIVFLYYLLFLGKLYLKRLDNFISHNNNLIINKEVANYIKDNNLGDIPSLYVIKYNEKGEIVSSSLDSRKINEYIGKSIKKLSSSIDNKIYISYIEKYFKTLKINNRKYILVPFGIVTNNPFLYNFGPKIALSYDLITSLLFNVEVSIKNYGLNNVIVETYLTIKIEQTILKPVVNKVTTYNNKFLLSTDIVYGKVSDYSGYNYLKYDGLVK